MTPQHDTASRLEQLETRLAWQDETLDALNLTVARLQEALRLQQDELRYLYRKLQHAEQADGIAGSGNERPPHY